MTAPWIDCEHFDSKHGYCIEGKDCSCGWRETQAVWLDDGDVQLYHGDACEVLRSLPAASVQTCVTSPPYWNLRDYGTGSWTGGDADCDHAPENARRGIERRSSTLGGGVAHLTAQEQGANAREECPRCGARRVDAQLGLEATPTAYVAALVAVFAEVWRVLRADGTLWLNLGDSYAGSSGNGGATEKQATNAGSFHDGGVRMPPGLKAKDLVGVPWMVARALQAPQYMGRIKIERDRVWLAATLDAEGTICGFHHERSDGDGTRTGIHVQITNTCMALLDEAHRIWPVSRSDHNPHSTGHLGTREVRRWIAHNVDDKALLLQELYPHLIAKRTQALLAWNFLEMSKVSKRIGKLAEGREAKERRSWIVHALSALNRGDGVDVPAWVKEPPTLFEDGWYLRSDCIWSKPNPMPESVTDRPTKAHEYVFLLAKQPRYYYDADAIREASEMRPQNRFTDGRGEKDVGYAPHRRAPGMTAPDGRNARSVWEIATQPTPEAHFATFPEALVRRCILAGTSEAGGCSVCGAPWQRQVERTPMVLDRSTRTHPMGRTRTSGTMVEPPTSTTTGWAPSCKCGAPAVPQQVLDPFVGSGTTALVARKHGRRATGIDLSADYLAIAARRLGQQSLFATSEGAA